MGDPSNTRAVLQGPLGFMGMPKSQAGILPEHCEIFNPGPSPLGPTHVLYELMFDPSCPRPPSIQAAAGAANAVLDRLGMELLQPRHGCGVLGHGRAFLGLAATLRG